MNIFIVYILHSIKQVECAIGVTGQLRTGRRELSKAGAVATRGIVENLNRRTYATALSRQAQLARPPAIHGPDLAGYKSCFLGR